MRNSAADATPWHDPTQTRAKYATHSIGAAAKSSGRPALASRAPLPVAAMWPEHARPDYARGGFRLSVVPGLLHCPRSPQPAMSTSLEIDQAIECGQ